MFNNRSINETITEVIKISDPNVIWFLSFAIVIVTITIIISIRYIRRKVI